MILEKLKTIYAQFINTDELVSFTQLASGHINDTFLIETKQNNFFVLQQINHGVFKDVPGLINNKVLISKHLQEKLAYLSPIELKRRVLSFIETVEGDYYHLDNNGNYWNMMIYIKDSITFETVNCEHVAFEGGKLIGDLCSYGSVRQQTPNLDKMANEFLSFLLMVFTCVKDSKFVGSFSKNNNLL